MIKYKVQPKPRWAWWQCAGFAWNGVVYLDNGLLAEYIQYRQNGLVLTPTVAHEIRHLDQQHQDGLLTFTWRYFTSKKWRLKYEQEAYEAQMRAVAEESTLHKLTDFIAQDVAHSLASPLYRNMISYADALTWARQVKNRINAGEAIA